MQAFLCCEIGPLLVRAHPHTNLGRYAAATPTMADVCVRPLQPADRAEHARMRIALWPDEDPDDLANSIEPLLSDPNQVAFVAERPDRSGLCGMV